MTNIKIFTLVGDINSLDHLNINECYEIFHELNNLDHLNACLYRIIENEWKLSKQLEYPGNFVTVHREDELMSRNRKRLTRITERRRNPPHKTDIYCVAVLFVDEQYTGHVYLWPHPDMEYAIRVQGIRTSIKNYTQTYFKGVGKTLIDSIVEYSKTKGYRLVSVWSPIGAMPGILIKYGFTEHGYLFKSKNKEEMFIAFYGYKDEFGHYYKNIFHPSDYIFLNLPMMRSPDISIVDYTIDEYKCDFHK